MTQQRACTSGDVALLASDPVIWCRKSAVAGIAGLPGSLQAEDVVDATSEARLGPGPVGYVKGSVGSGRIAAANAEALSRYRIVPRMLRDVRGPPPPSQPAIVALAGVPRWHREHAARILYCRNGALCGHVVRQLARTADGCPRIRNDYHFRLMRTSFLGGAVRHGKVPVRDLTGISETLLIPLIARAQARARFPDLGFADPAAERVLSQLDADPDRFGQHVPTMRGAIIRARAFDRIAAAFAAAHPGGLVVSLGAGLDTRAERLAASRLAWADVDLPAVAELRTRLLPPAIGQRIVRGSVTDPDWAVRIGWEPGQPLLLIAEAVLIYLDQADVNAFLTRLPGQFPTGAEIAVDYGAPLMVRNAGRHPGLKNTAARFQWSARGARQIARLHPRLRVLADRNLAGRAVSPGPQGWTLAATSLSLRIATGGWLYGLAHLAVQADPGSDPARTAGAGKRASGE